MSQRLLDNTRSADHVQAWTRNQFTAAGDARQQHHAPLTCAQRRPAKSLYLPTAISARVRAAHQLHGCFHVSPGFSLFCLTHLFAGASLLSGLNNCHLPMGLKQLSRIILDFDFSHPHGAILLSLPKQPLGRHEMGNAY